jgi:hypothetical protein
MATNTVYLLDDDIEQNLLEELASDQSSFSHVIIKHLKTLQHVSIFIRIYLCGRT